MSVKKVLVIGGHTGGIGDVVMEPLLRKILAGSRDMVDAYLPTREELDIRSSTSIGLFLRNHGSFDYIVYSAGISKLQWIKDFDQRDMDKAFDVNASGAVLVAQAHLNRYPDAKVRYAVVVSDATDTPMRGSIAYCASKAAEAMMVRVMARELAPLWTVVAISPGVVDDTGMTNQLAKDIPAFRNWTPEAARAYEDSGSVLGRRVTKEEVADAIVFALTGPEALNGSTITLNGGK